MFEVKDNKEIGAYLKKSILSKYRSCRQFCIAYLKFSGDDENPDEIRKLTNRVSQIINGKKTIQTYDLPLFSELLGVSCEEMLSAGAFRKPLTNRRTNYNIAFSKDKNDWIDYLNSKDCIFSYADEFGKTVIDYAIEFKNYDFLKFLMENGYITFVSNEGWGQEINFGASTTLKERIYDQYTLNEELQNARLRTQLIALALESNDDTVLEKLRAREVPSQLRMESFNCLSVSFREYYDENYVNVILHSNSKVFDYFCEEYSITSKYDKKEYEWIFPFFDKLIELAVKQKNSRVNKLLDIAIDHNQKFYINLKRSVLDAAKEVKRIYANSSGFMSIIDNVLRDFRLNDERNVFIFNCYFVKNSQVVTSNIIKVDAKSSDSNIQKKIDKLNELYFQIVNIRDYLIKQQ